MIPERIIFVSRGITVVETVLCGVPPVVVLVSGFYCRRMDYGVLVVGGESCGLCRVLRRSCSVRESVSHCDLVLW